MKWFTECKCIEDVKSRYHKLIFKYHPDRNNNSAESNKIMKEINAEYEIAFEKYKNIHRSVDGKTYENKTESAKTEIPAEFKKVINGLIHIPNITIELVGIFIWITGNTYPYKDVLKDLGFKWGSKKKAWYWHPEYYVHYSRYPKHKNLDELKEKWGSETIATESIPQIA